MGARYSARARGSEARAVRIGSWYATDLPDAVPVATTTWRPVKARVAAATWCDHGAVTP
ncbi:Uncharacterised protein [Mycobacteroides abscessus subsp. abscessus]|nr:Uncharacterised protein [Mycobacteroides abscessus subsp. abscessus]